MKNRKIIINFCPTGMVPDKALTPHVPVSPDEIIEQVHEAFEIGITIAHLHARDEEGVPTWRKETYRKIFEGVRKHCPGLVICGSTSGRNVKEFDKRSEVIELKPDMCSLTLSSLNFMKSASLNPPDMIVSLAEKMEQFGVHPELECFDFGMINYGNYLIRKGVLKGPYYWNLLFGNIAGFQANLTQIGNAVDLIPHDHYIGIGGLGNYQLKANSIAISVGKGVRTGIEDNIYWDVSQKKKCTNSELVDRVHRMIRIQGKEFYSSKELGEKGFYNSKQK